MASADRSFYTCYICLEVFTEPVSTPCGHNFCKACIFRAWSGPGPYRCPVCKEEFNSQPVLRVNTFISAMVTQFKSQTQKNPAPLLSTPGRTEVLHDSAPPLPQVLRDSAPPLPQVLRDSAPPLPQVLCDSAPPLPQVLRDSAPSLPQVLRGSAPSLPQVLRGSASPQPQVLHGSAPPQPQELCDFCTDPKNVALKFCKDCSSLFCFDHLQPHLTVVGLKRHQLTDSRRNLENLENHKLPATPKNDLDLYKYSSYTLTNRKIHERAGKLQEIRTTMEQSQRTANAKAKEVVEVFNGVVEEVQRSLDRFTDVIEESQHQAKKRARDMMQELEQEISELQTRESEERLIFLHGPAPVRPGPVLRDWDKVFIEPPEYEDTVSRVVSELQEKVNERLQALLVTYDLKKLQHWAVDLTFDPKSAHPKLVLSFDEKQVSYNDAKKKVSDSADRFTQCCNVMTRQSFSSGRFYFEILVRGKTHWDLGVAKKSVNRKKKIALSPANGFWTIWLRDGHQFSALESPPVPLTVKRAPQKIGVFVDYDVGVVSFYDADIGALLYSFTGCTFKDKLLPICNPCLSESGRNAAPLVLSPVRANREAAPTYPPQTQNQPIYFI